MSIQTSGLAKFGPGLTFRPTAYFNQLDELTNRFDNAAYTSQLLNGAFSEDASTKVFGGGAQLAYKIDARNLVTVSADAHREEWGGWLQPGYGSGQCRCAK